MVDDHAIDRARSLNAGLKHGGAFQMVASQAGELFRNVTLWLLILNWCMTRKTLHLVSMRLGWRQTGYGFRRGGKRNGLRCQEWVTV